MFLQFQQFRFEVFICMRKDVLMSIVRNGQPTIFLVTFLNVEDDTIDFWSYDESHCITFCPHNLDHQFIQLKHFLIFP